MCWRILPNFDIFVKQLEKRFLTHSENVLILFVLLIECNTEEICMGCVKIWLKGGEDPQVSMKMYNDIPPPI